ncbi:hypothetical protein ADK65_11895 [Streptomyces sp. NRRL B-1140]|nr:hypothetical protein ADK65_11895 [Streptomyces sp. NRRL B-1140]
MSGATSQRVAERAGAVVTVEARPVGEVLSDGAGTVTASPVPWHSRGGTALVRQASRASRPRSRVPHSSHSSSTGSRCAVPGAANSSIRPRNSATGPEPGPSSHSRSSMRRPNIAGALTTSKTEPQDSTTGASGRSSQRASVLRGYVPAEASQAAPSGVTSEAFHALLMADMSTRRERPAPEGCAKSGQEGVGESILPAWHMPRDR